MSEDRVEGPVAPGQGVEGYAVMGSAKLDLCRADLPAQVEVRAVSVMGEVVVLVPAGATVHLTGVSVMGERTSPPAPWAPVVHVNAVAVMGSVAVRAVDVPTGLAEAPPEVTVRDHHPSPGGPQVIQNPLTVPGASALQQRVRSALPAAAPAAAARGVGDIELVVPDGVRVDHSRARITGDVDCDDACGMTGRTLVITGSHTGERRDRHRGRGGLTAGCGTVSPPHAGPLPDGARTSSSGCVHCTRGCPGVGAVPARRPASPPLRARLPLPLV
jgi:hypothetical protein